MCLMQIKTMNSIFYSVAPDNVLVYPDLQKAMEVLSQPPYAQSIEQIFITGGQGVYKVQSLY